jgi:L-ribulose-5-phosphate 3-epimerase UlaE
MIITVFDALYMSSVAQNRSSVEVAADVYSKVLPDISNKRKYDNS